MDQPYLDLCEKVLKEGSFKENRTGVGTLSVFGHQMRFNLQDGFPLLTTKRVPFGLIKSELLWFLSGDTNIKYLVDNNNNIWNEWAFKNWIESDSFSELYSYKGTINPFVMVARDKGLNFRFEEDGKDFSRAYDHFMEFFVRKMKSDDYFAEAHGDLGSVYGKQWRDFNGVDQIKNVIEQIKVNPDSRRLIVSAWNPSEIDEMALPPCHTMFQFYVIDGKLSCQLYQRSADIFLGVPFNIASYALLTHLIAHETGLEVGEFIHTLGDAHLYNNHIDQVKEQLSRHMKDTPTLVLNKSVKSVFDFKMDDIKIEGYNPHPSISAPIAV